MDRRVAVRHDMVKRTQIAASTTALICTTLDLSVTGARLCLPEAAEFPQRVLLRLHDGAVRIARRRWQRGTQVGVEFDGQYPEGALLSRI